MCADSRHDPTGVTARGRQPWPNGVRRCFPAHGSVTGWSTGYLRAWEHTGVRRQFAAIADELEAMIRVVIVEPEPRSAWIARLGSWVLTAMAVMGCPAKPTATPEPVGSASEPVATGSSTEPRYGGPTSRPIEAWSGEEIEQQRQAELDREAEAEADDRAPDVDGVPHVDRVALPEARGAVLGVDHLGLDNVYLAARDDGLVLDTIHMSTEELVAIADELEAIAERTDADPPWLRDHAALVTFRPGQTMTVVSSTGRARRRLDAFQAERGASEGHLRARFERSRSVPSNAIVLRGSAHADAKLRSPRAVRPSDAVLAEVRRQVGDPALADRVLPEHLTVVDLRFRSKGSQLVVLSLFLEEVDDEWMAELSGAFVREPDGTVHSLAPVRRRHQPVDLDFLVDLDGDRIDEIVFRTDDASCGYRYLSVWDGQEYRNLRLDGSGG
jgi:hypothetical protein